MELTLFNLDLEPVGVIDVFESLIWRECYWEPGDFELVALPTEKYVSYLVQAAYATIEESERFMVIEDIDIKTDPVDGNRLTVVGRSGEIILDRRNVYYIFDFIDQDVDTAIYSLINSSCLADVSDPLREIPEMEYSHTTDVDILAMILTAQYNWEFQVLDAVTDICVNAGIGFKMTFDQDNGKFIFTLYNGVDRSYDQEIVPYVIFSTNYENLKNLTYMSTSRLVKTFAIVGGEKGVGNAQKMVEVDETYGMVSGLDRREMYLDAQDVRAQDENGDPITDSEYEDRLIQRGLEELSQDQVVQAFSSEIDPVKGFVYGEDFFLGDIVQITNEFGYDGKSRVIEVIRTQDVTGSRVSPTFSDV